MEDFIFYVTHGLCGKKKKKLTWMFTVTLTLTSSMAVFLNFYKAVSSSLK